MFTIYVTLSPRGCVELVSWYGSAELSNCKSNKSPHVGCILVVRPDHLHTSRGRVDSGTVPMDVVSQSVVGA